MSETNRSTHGSDGPDSGRGEKGRFAPGNKLGRGNPLAGRAAKIRAVLLRKLTPKDAAEIADVLIAQAKGGDLAAIKELLDRTIGKPVGEAPTATATSIVLRDETAGGKIDYDAIENELRNLAFDHERFGQLFRSDPQADRQG